MSTKAPDVLPSGWSLTTLGEAFQWGSGGTPRSTEPRFYDGHIPWAVIGDLNDGRVVTTAMQITEAGLENSSAKMVSQGSVLIAMYGSIGKLGIAGIDLATNQAIAFTNPAPVEAKYLFWYLRWKRDELVQHGKGGTQQNISQTVLKGFPFRLAPMAEQYRIVAAIEEHLSRLDAAVGGLERVHAQLPRYRAASISSACEGNLVPLEAELARREGRTYESATALLERTALARERLVNERKSPRGLAAHAQGSGAEREALPEGWTWATWGRIGFSQNGRAFPSSEYSQQGIRLLRPGNLHASGTVSWTNDNTRRLPQKWASDFPEFLVGENELVMNLTAQSLKDEFLGRTCITGSGEPCLLNQRIARLTPILVEPRYLLWLFKSRRFRRYVDSLNTGSLIQHMFTSQLAEFVLPLPPLEEQKRIVGEIERRASLAEVAENAIEVTLKRATFLRQSIFRAAFSGRLVPQDPNDEPAHILLERIRAQRGAQADNGRRGRRTARNVDPGATLSPATATEPLHRAPRTPRSPGARRARGRNG